MPRNTVVINFSAPPALATQITKVAKKEGRTKSELLRTAFLAYSFDKELERFQMMGQIISQKLGLESYDEIEEYLEK